MAAEARRRHHTRFDGIGVDCFGEHDEEWASQLVRPVIVLREHSILARVQLEFQSEIRESRPHLGRAKETFGAEQIVALGRVAHVIVGGDEVRYRDETSRARLELGMDLYMKSRASITASRSLSTECDLRVTAEAEALMSYARSVGAARDDCLEVVLSTGLGVILTKEKGSSVEAWVWANERDDTECLGRISLDVDDK